MYPLVNGVACLSPKSCFFFFVRSLLFIAGVGPDARGGGCWNLVFGICFLVFSMCVVYDAVCFFVVFAAVPEARVFSAVPAP